MVVRDVTVLETWLVRSQELLANIFHVLFVINITLKNLKREMRGQESWCKGKEVGRALEMAVFLTF